ncbi:MAG TPA: hypothetical protein VEU51_05665, partial [Candidatus Acidoferrales bacterium]|nr:hypothetical protein [Candidatus Acidoferrales bacterium]
MSPAPPVSQSAQSRWQWFAAWLGVAIVSMLAIRRLRDFPAHLSWIDAYVGMREVLPQTAWAALKVWTFWGWSAAVIAGFTLRADPEIELSDALLAGAVGPWLVAYLLGNLLGPIGLFNTPTVWGLLALGTVYLWQHPPVVKFGRWSSGQKLAALAVALLAISYLPLQLGSPVAPFMDVLSYPSSAQRILTFGKYLPFNNDPYGCWGPYAQTPALELFYTMLALGSHTRLATLAETGAMLPMAALIIFATYRLGKMAFGDTAGGMAALMLFATSMFRRAQGMRGTAVDFALVAIGLAFFLNPKRSRVLVAIGAMMLGTAVASHAIDGAFALIVAATGIAYWLLERDYARVEATVLALAGALLIASPEFLIGMVRPVPYPSLPMLQIVGVGLIVLGARRIRPDNLPQSREAGAASCAWLSIGLFAVFIFAVLYRNSVEPFSVYSKIAANLPMLSLYCFVGLIVAIGMLWTGEGGATPYAGFIALALLLGIAVEFAGPILDKFSRDAASGMIVADINTKVWEYWCPYFLTLPAGLLFGAAYDRWSKPAVLFAVLALLIYPWNVLKEPTDYDANEHSIAENWAFNLSTAGQGYWLGHVDRHWTFGSEDRPLIAKLEDEIRAGRITLDTHILHLCDTISSWTLVQFAVVTGINDDPIEYQHDPNNQWEGGSRVRGLNDLNAALASRPPYILVQSAPPGALGDPPQGYELILTSGYIRLYRRKDLTASPSRGIGAYRYLVAIAALAGVAIVIWRRKDGDARATA